MHLAAFGCVVTALPWELKKTQYSQLDFKMNHTHLAWQGIRRKAQRSGNPLAAFYKTMGTSLVNSLFITKDINPPPDTKNQSLRRRQIPTIATSGARGKQGNVCLEY